MENKTITTPSGYVVTLRPFITYTKFIDMQRDLTKDVKVDPNAKNIDGTPKAPDVPAYALNDLLDVQEKTMRYLILGITDKDGNKVDTSEDYLPLPPQDSMAVVDAVTAISDEAVLAYDKKK